MEPEEKYPSRRKRRETRGYVLLAIVAIGIAIGIVLLQGDRTPSDGVEPLQQGTEQGGGS
ncbi:hypothetical protein [Jiella sonneratiae]|uniref:Uncharacterized protein n=1 Tax=Jiella sonneratiae TaxID=2816856 RepID=A0ABS3J5R9_9HYPH|nr:hypothetical protein [Jiella sonneratiae]MBO0905019.1 hypothetical protein [Jiella sonneratiae]